MYSFHRRSGADGMGEGGALDLFWITKRVPTNSERTAVMMMLPIAALKMPLASSGIFARSEISSIIFFISSVVKCTGVL